MNYSEHKHVVVIYPHPDDESFGVAGTVTNFRKAGVPVTYLCGTLGEMGRNMGSPFFANRETLPEIRKKELIDACEVLDMNLEMLGYRDKTLEFEPREEVAENLKNYIEDLGATLVITFYPPFAVHPDHNALGAAAFEAVRKIDREKRPELWANAISNDREEKLGKPEIVIDTEEVFDIKLKALKSHRSQAEGMLSKMNASENFIGEYESALKRLQYEAFHRVDVDKVSY
ncbi:bacillithiol biosynthesis deacetylase BshB2 [Halalkalibacillus sediminis]|uniref:Bacillithiol biosynthesis deacetylase BshB2 n=1 Tax=Halalkalibacillus sediminis TaxID=2018042 RepID=A0A2I0QUI8_9BACI|nr:bacillithiol biosynthesis deacetylase BshB2 [Halalkalibacillus sediminis]PKR78007.1 bacillithiol biosynthesis deacetylase BshB2 [Halalkalibacillus sediminis]